MKHTRTKVDACKVNKQTGLKCTQDMHNLRVYANNV